MKISQREMVLGVVTLTAILAGATWYLVNQKIDIHKANKIQIEQLKQQARLDNRRIKMQDEWIAELNELQKDLRVFDTNLKNPSPELMKTINAVAQKYNLDINRNQPRGEKPTGDLFELSINCTWEGKLEAMVDFLTDLQQQGVRYDVRSLNITPVGKNSGRLKGNMLINCAYMRKPNTENNK
ncbi:MAG: type II secretion system protein M [Kiritimatiellaceae bacterium]|nr:type II secretion system protein M [Kiritimatiellaceae bacterium]